MKKKSVIIFDPKAPTGKDKRPNHPDFWDDKERRDNKWTGIRKNDMLTRWEFWILGRMEKEVSFLRVSVDEYALTKAHMELFGMDADPKLFKGKRK